MFSRNAVFLFAAISAVIAILATIFVIYLTPLKYMNLVAPAVHEMDPSAFWKDYTAHPDEYLFIDVRDPDEYNIAHAKGSINMPIATLADEYKVLPRHGKFIALICGDGRLSMVGYGFLQFEGFTNLIHITGGIQNWIVEGLPVTQGTSTRISTSTVLSSTMTTGTPPGCPKIS